jgi:DNA topoisomerase-1
VSKKPLVVVESPTKVRTLKKVLGSGYDVAATMGHIRDLPPKEIGIDIENGFKPKYRTIPGKQKVITTLKRAAGETEEVYLAPDPDREGEAIAWHTSEVLKKKGRRFHRVLFHELTKNAILQAMKMTKDLDRNRFEAQQARRILDRLVGYQISPLLWRKVHGGLSAGRVQSVAVRIICDRERAIQAFEPEEYWSITANLEGPEPPPFEAKLVRKDGKKIRIESGEAAENILKDLEGADFTVDKVLKKTRRRNPMPPFTTSKLQQDSIRRLRFSAKKTMTIAQQLYEGVDLGPGEPVGLITYMRTDSTRIAAEAANEALDLVRNAYGKAYAEEKPRYFKNKNKAQDAHEAIRPTSVFNTPEKIEPYLSADQAALYRLIWQRFVASQMKPAIIDQNTVSINARQYQFTATGSVITFPGFMALYTSPDQETDDEKKGQLPELAEKTVLTIEKLTPRQHFTMPPPRFSEASLVKELEENGIGRPSTYAAILSTIRDKGYVDMVKGYFRPSELGFIVNDLVVASFPDIFDVEFTARMENDLDRIESDEAEAQDVLTRFYASFEKELSAAKEGMVSVKGVGLPTGLSCPECGKPLHIKMGKNGHFLACSGYPDCRYSRDYVRDEKGNIEPVEPVSEEPTDEACEKCGRPMVLKNGKYGTFLACSGYPECKNTRSAGASDPNRQTGVACPVPGCTGQIVEKRSKRGKIFYGCERFPDCDFAIWDKPVPRPCPQCGASFLVEKTTKKDGTFLKCNEKACGYKEQSE